MLLVEDGKPLSQRFRPQNIFRPSPTFKVRRPSSAIRTEGRALVARTPQSPDYHRRDLLRPDVRSHLRISTGDSAVRKLYVNLRSVQRRFPTTPSFAEASGKTSAWPETAGNHFGTTGHFDRRARARHRGGYRGSRCFNLRSKRLLDPLGMTDTRVLCRGLPRSGRVFAEPMPDDRFVTPGRRDQGSDVPRRWESGGAGMVGTIGD